MKTSVVLFDAAGVLFPLNNVVGEELQRVFNLTEERLGHFWRDGLYKRLAVGKITTDEFLEAFADEFGLEKEKVTRGLFVNAFQEALTPMPGVQELLERIAQTDVHIALLSDTVEMYADIRHKLGYYKHFEKLFLSYETGVLKPDPKAYQNVIDHYQVQPEEIFFIDDTLKNIVGAQNAGVRAVQFQDAKQLEEALVREGIVGD